MIREAANGKAHLVGVRAPAGPATLRAARLLESATSSSDALVHPDTLARPPRARWST